MSEEEFKNIDIESREEKKSHKIKSLQENNSNFHFSFFFSTKSKTNSLNPSKSSKNSQISIKLLPQELLRIILEYLFYNSKDLLRFGGVCQEWRNIMIVSPLWLRLTPENEFFSISLQKKQQSSSSEIFHLFRIKIIDWNIRQNEIKQQEKNALLELSSSRATDLFLFITGLCFGINWKDPFIIHIIGFISGYFFLISNGISVYLNKKGVIDINSEVISSGIYLLSLLLAQLKSMIFHSSLPWIYVILPIYFDTAIKIPFSLKKLFQSQTFDNFFPIIGYVALVFPILIALWLYCYHLDNPNDPIFIKFPVINVIYIIIPFIFLCLLIFLDMWWKSIMKIGDSIQSLYHNSNSTEGKKLLFSTLRFLISCFALFSLVFLVIQNFPSHRIQFLFQYFNFIFYLVIIVDCININIYLDSQSF